MEGAGHLPVLLDEVLAVLSPAGRHVLVDCTVGLGGHAEGLLRAADPGTTLIGIDLDESNLARCRERLAAWSTQVRLFSANFADIREVLTEAGLTAADAVLADLGVCSVHLDDPARGFSFQTAGPLDMRLSGQGPSAADMVNTLDEGELADVIWRYGEERLSRRIARAIVRARKVRRIETTTELAAIVEQAQPPRRPWIQAIHPATRTFQGIRIAVNRELENLERLLANLPRALAVGGRAAVISFHSLEDRIVKHAFAEFAREGRVKVLTKKPMMASMEECGRNPRSRSAKLRAIERI